MIENNFYAAGHPLGKADVTLKDRWNFHVSLELPDDLKHCAKPVELMVGAVDLGAENLMPPNEDGSLHHRSGRIILWLYDDLDGVMMRSVREIQRANVMFTVRVGLCGDKGFPELEEFTFTGAHLDCIQHSLFTYEDAAERLKLKGYVPGPMVDRDGWAVPPKHGEVEIQGTISNSTSRNISMKLLQIGFNSMTHEFFDQV